MSEETEDALRARTDRLTWALAEASEQQDAWLVALYSVDLDDAERLCRARGIDPVKEPRQEDDR
ncbi:MULTISPECIES: hypothetical protein [unclassified Kitasatospora]|uniref:hypothetical protein n=1 Tax=unclassified Kitasatospora TaxID=2633591 RepID=UPI000B196C51|nr:MULTISPECIES: hypothetical protein [unclassified Kitasatospora]